jgi:hypothetical protein
MTLDKLVLGIIDQVPLLVAIVIIVWLSLPQLAERFETISKLLRPLSRRWREKAERLDAERRQVALDEAKKLAAAAIKEMTPPDVTEMERRMARISLQLRTVEDAEDCLRAYVIFDELWHFKDDHNEARSGRVPQIRMAFDLFELKWKAGWRPFDEEGKLVDDGSSGPPFPG